MGDTQAEIARTFNVSQATISRESPLSEARAQAWARSAPIRFSCRTECTSIGGRNVCLLRECIAKLFLH
jgi:hypothetical protein